MNQTAKTLRHRIALDARCLGRLARFMIMPRFLDDKAPLVSQLHLAHGFSTPWTVHLPGTRIALLRGAAVLDAAAVTHQVESSRLALTVITGPQLYNTVALVFGNTLYGSQKIFKSTVYAFGRRSQGRSRRLGHGRSGGVSVAGT